MDRHVVVVGSTNVDFVTRLPRLPGIGDCVTDGQFTRAFGGKGANTAVAAARLGNRTLASFITALGDDPFAPQLLESFRLDGLDTARVRVVPGRPTGCALIMLDQLGRNYIAVAPGANDALGPAEMDDAADLIRGADIVLLQMEIPTDTVRRAVELASGCGVRVLLNYAPVRNSSLPVDHRLHVLVVNEAEASQLSGTEVRDVDSASRAALDLHRRGPAIVVVTLGGDGCIVRDETGSHHQRAFPVEAVDTTAAGDTFCGALGVSLAERRPLLEAVRFASAAAAIACTRLGAQPSIPRRAEVDAFLATHDARAEGDTRPGR